MITTPPALGDKLWILTGRRSTPVQEVTVVGVSIGLTEDYHTATTVKVYCTDGIDRRFSPNRTYPTQVAALKAAQQNMLDSARGYASRAAEDNAAAVGIGARIEALLASETVDTTSEERDTP